jgi:iron complex transport system substrate-binding protein
MNRSWTILSALLITLTASISTLGTGSEEDYTLGIFGNANMDSSIDEADIAYVQGVIQGTNDASNLSDANYDGNIDQSDIDQINLIIQGTEKKLTVIDDSGRTVTVNKPISRIATLSYRFPELLIAIGAKDKIVGVEERFKTRTKDIAEACDMMDVLVCGTSDDPDYEQILELKPDVVITGSSNAKEVSEKIPSIPVIGISSFVSSIEPNSVISDLRLLGMIADEAEGAENLIDFMKNYEGIIDERTKGVKSEEMPTFYLEGPMNYSIYGPSGSPGKVLAEGCGGLNVASEMDIGSSSIEVSPEWVLEKNPDIIIKRADFLGLDATEQDAEKALNELISRTGWTEIQAVKNSRVYLLEGDLMWTPRYLAGRCYLAKWLHPELFNDLDPEEILQRYHEEFLGIEYRGIWAYAMR